MRSATRACLAESRGGSLATRSTEPLALATACFVAPLTLAPFVCRAAGLPCDTCDLTAIRAFTVAWRLSFFAFGFAGAATARNLARFFAARTRAATSWSLRIECQPESPLLLAISARSFQLWVLREAVVIKGR